jgi:hypothetical protein
MNPRQIIETFLPGTQHLAGSIIQRLEDHGYVIVPKDPTEKMVEAAYHRSDDQPPNDWGNAVDAPFDELYRAMIAAR